MSAEPGAPGPGPRPPSPTTVVPPRGLAGAVVAVLGAAAVAAVLSAAGVGGQPVAGLALLFLLAGPGAALGWALPGQELRLRLLAALFGGLVVDTLIAQAMLVLRLWSPRAGALAALAVTAALLCCGAFGTRRPAERAAGRTPAGHAATGPTATTATTTGLTGTTD